MGSIKRYFYYFNGKLYYDQELTDMVPFSNVTYSVLQFYKIPSYLTNVIVYEQSLKKALSSLIFIGTDSKGRKQYFYGKNHVLMRNKNRDAIFVKVYNIIKKIYKYIDTHINEESSELNFQLAVFMLMETSFYIRIGKVKYYKQNDTVGLLTLRNKHISVYDNRIVIRFPGKDKVAHEFIVKKGDKLYYPLLKMHNKLKPELVLFSLLSEKKIYSFINQFNIKIKDLRTYGVNITFLYNVWNNVLSMIKLPSVKKLISISIKQTADTIGHSPNISKHAYMAITVLELMNEDNIIDIIKQKSFDDFLLYVVKYVDKKNCT